MTEELKSADKTVAAKPKAKQAASPAAASKAPVAAPAKPARRRASPPASADQAVTKARPAVKKAPAKPAPRATKASAKPVAPVAKPAKVKKAKLVRDSFTMPEAEYQAIAVLKKRCLNSGVAAKKSQILRAAIAVLAKLSDAQLTAAIQGLAEIKTGRPAKGGK